MTKPLVIYHGNCADGFGAAWVFNQFGDFDFHPGVYNKTPPDVRGKDVYLVDFSYKPRVVEEMLQHTKSVTLIDHHRSAIEELKPLIESGRIDALADVTHSGAMLAWKWFNSTERGAPQLLFHIEDRDLWRFALPYTREIQQNLFSYPYDFKVWDELMRKPVDELIRDGTAIDRKHMKDINELIEVGRRTFNIGGYRVPVVNLPYVFSSEAGHLLAAGQPFAACYFDTPDGRVFSLRSTKGAGVDVDKIAQLYGGGGHPNAAGFSVPYGHELAR